MKKSKYNYLFKIENSYILFNGYTLRIYKFSDYLKNNIVKILNNPNNIQEEEIPLKQKLVKNGYLVPKNENEEEKVKLKITKSISQPYYVLTIFPTYDCIFNCWYCVQKHKNEYISPELTEAIKLHIQKYIIHNEIKKFEIHWFGGEPLLCFNDQIENISNFAKIFCEANGISFYNNITTNGYLLNPEIIKKMKLLNFKQFQITIDGSEKNHNIIRNHRGIPSFNTILNNINLVIEKIPDVRMFLRFNYTKDTILEYDTMIQKLNNYFPLEKRSRILVTAVKVWQEDSKKIDSAQIKSMYDSFKQNGYTIADVELNTNFVLCDAAYKFSHVIFHNGNVDKCNNINPEDAHWHLTRNGDIVQIKEDDIPDVFQSMCYSCKHFPICLGPCLKCLRESAPKQKIKCVEKQCIQDNIQRIKSYCYSMIKPDNNDYFFSKHKQKLQRRQTRQHDYSNKKKSGKFKIRNIYHCLE